MTDAKYDVLGIGNAIFDVLVQTDEGFLARHGMTKGGMALIDEARAAAIYKDMGPATEMSGGSGANTIVGVAGFGARAAFIGKVKADQIGTLYTHDIRAAGVAFETKAAESGPATGCSYILVTPDGERTMNTYLGAAQDLNPSDIDDSLIAAYYALYTANPFCPASSFSDTCGRAPMCWITSAAASAPRRPHVSWLASRTRPNRKPAAKRSPAPVVSTSF